LDYGYKAIDFGCGLSDCQTLVEVCALLSAIPLMSIYGGTLRSWTVSLPDKQF